MPVTGFIQACNMYDTDRPRHVCNMSVTGYMPATGRELGHFRSVIGLLQACNLQIPTGLYRPARNIYAGLYRPARNIYTGLYRPLHRPVPGQRPVIDLYHTCSPVSTHTDLYRSERLSVHMYIHV